jgi:catechol 2,3-dioxygenase-like lactoylglutathione lyase family enzyme
LPARYLDDAMRAQLQSVTPLLPAGLSLDDALAFYVDHMGFAVTWRHGDMAGIARDGVAFNLVVNDERAWADNASFSIATADLDALYTEYRDIPARWKPSPGAGANFMSSCPTACACSSIRPIEGTSKNFEVPAARSRAARDRARKRLIGGDEFGPASDSPTRKAVGTTIFEVTLMGVCMEIQLEGLCPLIQVFDMHASLGFYRDVLGFQVTQRAPDTEDCEWCLLCRNGMEIMLNTQYERDDRPDRQRHRTRHGARRHGVLRRLPRSRCGLSAAVRAGRSGRRAGGHALRHEATDAARPGRLRGLPAMARGVSPHGFPGGRDVAGGA